MDGFARSTIAALFYAQPDQVVFKDLVADLASSLLRNAQSGLDIHTQYDDFVIFDLDDKRICLAHSPLASDFPDAARRYLCAEAVVISVGDRPGAQPCQDGAQLCATLSDRIEAREPADGTLVAESDLAFSEDAFDAALEDILSAYWVDDAHAPQEDTVAPVTVAAEADAIGLPEDIAETLFAPKLVYSNPAVAAPPPDVIPPPENAPARLTAALPRPRRAKAFEMFRPSALTRDLASRIDREIAARETARTVPRQSQPRTPSPGPTLFPSTTYGEPRPVPPPRTTRAASTFTPVRQRQASHHEALFPPTEVALAKPLVHRSAIHAMNAAMLVFSLPMGAFLMTLGVLGRESLTMSSRMTAVTGAGMGIAQNDSVASFVSSLI